MTHLNFMLLLLISVFSITLEAQKFPDLKPEKIYRIGDLAPDFKLKGTGEQSYSLSDLKGKIVVLDFWASWCGPCRQQLPHIKKIHNHYSSKKDFIMVSVSIDSQESKWRSTIVKLKVPGLNLLTDQDTYAKLREAYSVLSIPKTFLIDKDGRFLGMNLSPGELEEKLEAIYN